MRRIHTALLMSLCLLCGVARADVKPLPPSEWPLTVGEAVPKLIAVMSPTQRHIIGGTTKDNLFLFQGEWGDDIEHFLGLEHGNTALVQAACGSACPVDQATLKLMEAVWEALPK